MAPYIISFLIALGVYFLGKFIGKRFNLSPNSYLGFAIISFVLAFICHTKGQEALLKFFANFPFIDRSTVIWSIIGLCGIFLLLIFFVEGRRRHGLSLEIDYNLELLHDFWKEIGIPSTEPMTVAQAFAKSQRVVAEDPTAGAIHTIRKDYYLTESPDWHHKIFDKPTSLDALSEKKQQDTRWFYDKLSTITSTYEKLRTSKGATIIGELENNLEIIITEVLEQGNPLKPT